MGSQQYEVDILIGVASGGLYAGLISLLNLGHSRVASGNPRYRRLRLVIAFLSWAASNSIYGYYRHDRFHFKVFLVLSTLIFAWILYSELNQFWGIGLVGADAQVKGGVDYAKALKLCSNSLDFLGIGASKLTQEHPEFEAAINRCSRPDRPIRFLLSSPENENLQRIARSAGRDRTDYQEIVRTSLRVIAGLKNERQKHIIVKFYSEIPTFRLMFINDDVCLASHFVLGKGDGSQLPQLHIVKTSESQDVDSLFYGFRDYFERIWDESENWDFQKYLEPSL